MKMTTEEITTTGIKRGKPQEIELEGKNAGRVRYPAGVSICMLRYLDSPRRIVRDLASLKSSLVSAGPPAYALETSLSVGVLKM